MTILEKLDAERRRVNGFFLNLMRDLGQSDPSSTVNALEPVPDLLEPAIAVRTQLQLPPVPDLQPIEEDSIGVRPAETPPTDRFAALPNVDSLEPAIAVRARLQLPPEPDLQPIAEDLIGIRPRPPAPDENAEKVAEAPTNQPSETATSEDSGTE